MNSARALAIIWSVLTPAQRRRFVALQFVSVLMALSTVMGLAAVMTFLAVLADPELIESRAVLRWLWQVSGASRPDFLVVLGSGFIVFLFLSAVVNVAGLRAMGRFAFSVGDRIREALFAGYLRRDYLFHARTVAARLMDNVLYQADRVPITLLNGLVLITNAMLTLLVVVSIAVVNTAVALGGVLVVGGCYLLLYRMVRRRIARSGQLLVRRGAERTAVVEEAFLGIKYLLISGAQGAFDKRFATATRTLSQAQADTQFIGLFPKYVLECVAGATLIACAAFVSGGTASGAWLAQLSFIGFAGFRLLPAIQQMYNAIVTIRVNRAAIENVAVELGGAASSQVSARPPESGKLALSDGIELADVSFRYSAETPLILDSASLRVPAGAAVGIVGASGCGKTTLVDLILGLLFPLRGRIEIDGEVLDAQRVAAWQRSIGYVPQEVTILAASVRENIAFGVEPDEIDDRLVRDAARQAGAAEFIESMTGGYAAKILGAGFSGGQRQRIGIARALYHQPSLLVLDEATNALDAHTERAIIDTVVSGRGARTVLIVAHGAAVIGACDRVYELRDGHLHERVKRAEPARA